MDQRDTDRLAELFEHALTLSHDDRRRYAREACSDDPELCSELLSLLVAHDEAPGYLERLARQLQPAALAPTHSFEPSVPSEPGIENRASLRVGQRFGHYQIGRLLGQGGMGHVWEAADLATGRHVALKAVSRRLRSAAVVLDETAGGGVVVGFDEQLARRVWIRHAPPGTPAVSLGRRSVSRPTRLRWLTGWRDTDDGWDAYEAADGEPLRSVTRRPRSWATVRTWLRDLAQEMTAAEKDGTQLPLDLERIWISDGRARLLDWQPDGVEGAGELPGSKNSRDVDRVQHFLHGAAVIGLRIGEPSLNRSAGPAALPLHAREFLDDLASKRFDTTAAIVERLRSLATRPVTVTRTRRCAHLALSGAAPLMAALLFVPAVTILLGWRLALVGILLLLTSSATLGVLSAFFARGGAIFRLLGIAVVDKAGREVSRFRACARALIAWAPGIAALLLLLPVGTLRSAEDLSVAQLRPSLVLLGVFVAGAMVALFNVPHGLQDRIARTSLVAR